MGVNHRYGAGNHHPWGLGNFCRDETYWQTLPCQRSAEERRFKDTLLTHTLFQLLTLLCYLLPLCRYHTVVMVVSTNTGRDQSGYIYAKKHSLKQLLEDNVTIYRAKSVKPLQFRTLERSPALKNGYRLLASL